MALRGDPVERARSMVGVALHALGADPDRTALGKDTWLVANGSAAVMVRLVAHGTDPQAGDIHVQVVSPVMRVADEPGFLQRLLQLNHEMGGLATFTITPQREVHLVSARTFRDLSAPDVARLIAQVAHFSDTYDDPLLAEYGAHHALRPRPPRAAGPAPGPQPAAPSVPGLPALRMPPAPTTTPQAQPHPPTVHPPAPAPTPPQGVAQGFPVGAPQGTRGATPSAWPGAGRARRPPAR